MKRIVNELREMLSDLASGPNQVLTTIRAPFTRRRYRQQHLRGWFVVRDRRKVCFLRCLHDKTPFYRFEVTAITCKPEELAETLEFACVRGGNDCLLRDASGMIEIKANEHFLGGLAEDGNITMRDMRPV